ncbi:hypothetical protein LCGC14_2070230, partial [marine sediment metagenome]
ALSSTCAERLALNQKVPGSNPGGLTTTARGFDVRKRIVWYLTERTAVAMSSEDVLPTKFEWRDLSRPIIEKKQGQSGFATYRDFRDDENKVMLLWDGINTDEFLNEVVLKQFIIRLTYNIGNDELVPSELLADANLVYESGDWVDVWGCRDKNDEIIECPRKIFRPADRNIQIMHGNDLQHDSHRLITPSRRQQIRALIGNREIPAIIEVPDEKCFYSFRAGGFYEKDQKPSEGTCEKGEKAV